MKKLLGIAVLGALSMTLLTATTALAQSGGSAIPPGDDGVLPHVIVNAPGGVAFTGSEITVWMVVAVALLAVGVAFLIAARRRAKTAGNS
jgi:LPXTG-motif cell wall-anchored protein